MKTSDFDFGVPRELVAQVPVEPRDSSRLLVLDRKKDKLEHRRFNELPAFLEEGDALVFNDSRVIPARLRGNLHLEPMSEIVIVLLRDLGDHVWEAEVEVGEVKIADIVDFTGLYGQVIKLGERIGRREERLVHIVISDEDALEKAGEPPVPPYIHGYKGDPERYQTVYSRIRGSAAAPTAGLHFTDRLLNELREKGVNLCFVTLHVGLDTFMPVYEDHPEEHKMYTEYCYLGKEVVEVLQKTKEMGKRVICVGTTSCRTLETASQNGRLVPFIGPTSLYILPGYQWKSVDCMITNFHYPSSTNLIMLASFVGLERLRAAYMEAVRLKYRFYSFGDSMLVL